MFLLIYWILIRNILLSGLNISYLRVMNFF
jgi:hypothetical protein